MVDFAVRRSPALPAGQHYRADNPGALEFWTEPLLVSGVLASEQGGTGATSLSALKALLAIQNVDNTSDAEKPVSTATRDAIDAVIAMIDVGGGITDPELLALAALASAANKVPYFTGSGTAALADLTAFARTLLDDVDAAAARATLGLGSAATAASNTFAAATHTHAIADVSGLQAALNAVTLNDPELLALAALTSAANKLPYFTGAGTAATADLTGFIRTLLDDADAATARSTLGAASTVHSHAIADTTGLQVALDAKSAVTRTINAQTGTAYTLILGDAGGVVTMSNAAANSVTVPPNSAVAAPLGAQVDLAQLGAGQTTIAAGAGVTLRSSGGKLKLTGQYSTASLLKLAANEWLLMGDIVV